MLRLITFGGLSLEASAGTSAPRLSSLRLALLAVLASAGERGVSRERVIGLFWPDSDDERARHSLRQALYALRHEVGVEVPPASAALSLDRAVVSSDIADYQAALLRGDHEGAVALATGPFLQGFYVRAAPEFQRWVDDEQSRLQGSICQALLTLAGDATSAGHHQRASEWWQRLATLDPLNGRYAAGYIASLAACGERAKALAFARVHGELVRRELDADADPTVQRLEADLRLGATPADVPSTAPAKSRGITSPSRDSVPSVVHDRVPAPLVTDPPDHGTVPRTHRPLRYARVAVLVATLALSLPVVRLVREWLGERGAPAVMTMAVGRIRDDSRSSTAASNGMLTDMLNTNLARIDGLQVVANSRMLEALRAGNDTTATGWADAARRAGATELVEGTVYVGRDSTFSMEVRRIDLRRGVVRRAYRVSGSDRFALVDSVTAEMARQFDLERPRSSIADATTRSLVAYRLYEEGLRANFAGDVAAAYRLMLASSREDSTFAMAAYYEALLAVDPERNAAMARALRLASHAADRERLFITADITSRLQSPSSISVAETLTTRFPSDPRAQQTLARALVFAGDWPRAVRALERAVALDSAIDAPGRGTCFVCDDLSLLSETYFWWDSLDAADRTAQRYRRMRPRSEQPWMLLTASAAKRGDSVEAVANLHRYSALNANGIDPAIEPRMDLMLERYDNVERNLRPLLESPRTAQYDDGHWLMIIALRNEGRLLDAMQFLRTGRLPGDSMPVSRVPLDDVNSALVAFESGNMPRALSWFAERRRAVGTQGFPGLLARGYAWTGTLLGMAVGAAGDTTYLRQLADTVQYWGERSSFGRDRRAHHYLRGLLAVAQGRDDEAVREYRAAVHSVSLGFTRVNYELAKALLRQRQPRAAVEALQPALRGEIDAANLYVTRTDLHELLADAYVQLAQRDSAAVHYRAVVRAWRRADPQFRDRRARARDWLARYERSARVARVR